LIGLFDFFFTGPEDFQNDTWKGGGRISVVSLALAQSIPVILPTTSWTWALAKTDESVHF
jgi:hypothetical protein